MRRFADLVLKHRPWVIIGSVALTAFFGLGFLRLWVNSDIISYLKPDDPAVKLFNRIGEEYEGNQIVMVGIEADDVFSPRVLRLVGDMTEAFKRLDGVGSVTSLTNTIDIREVDGTLEVGDLIPKGELPSSPEELKRLREYVLSKRMFRGRLVSEDGKVTLIVCRIRQGVDKTEVARRIKEIADSMGKGVKIYYSGIPISVLESRKMIVGDIKRLVPIAVAVVVLVLFFSFRTARGVVLPLLAVLMSAVWAIGLMGWFNVPLSIVSNVVPVLLIAIGTAYGIHLLSKYYEEEEGDGKERVRRALGEVGAPILLAGLTTMIGFLSFIGAYITAISDAGIFTAIGVAAATLISLSFIPAALSFLKPAHRVGGRVNGRLFSRAMSRLADFIIRRRKMLAAVSFALLAAAIAGLPRIDRQVDLMEYFPEDSPVRASERMMREKFGGSVPIQIVVKGDLKNPFVLKQMRRMEKFLDSLPYVSRSQSVADLICEMNRVMNGRYTVPETAEGVANLWFFIEGKDILRQLVNDDRTEGIIQAQVGTSDTGISLRIVEAVERYISSMPSQLRVVRIPELESGELERVKEWLYGEIAERILLDAKARDPGFEMDLSRLKAEVEKALESEVKPSEEEIAGLRGELREYFELESELMVPEEAIDPLVEGALRLVSLGRADKPSCLALLKENVPPEVLNEDPEAVELTAETLASKIGEALGRVKVRTAASELMSLFPERVRSDPHFVEDLISDLWLANEKELGVPAELGLKGEEVGFEMIQSGLIIYKRLDASLLKSQIQSLLIAFLLVFILLSIQNRSVRMGLITSSPIALTVLINFAVMAYAGVALDLVTMMIAGVAIGIGIDYAIHFSSRYKLELEKLSDPELAVERTLKTTGRAILVNALTVALGFSVLMFGQLSPVRRFGWMMAMTMIVSALAAIIYLPAMLLLSGKTGQIPKMKGGMGR
ncbi:hypothetical protein DRP77_02520 [Candidatus Poribacteria bacterium]|nr:MAG: hypothetical protein DRP77_02520 [Candidatus Poribacteria bacterium]